MSDPFGAPLPHAVRGKGKGNAYIDPAGIRRDRWDRPILPHPDTGIDQPWTSVTTLAGTLADRYALSQWQLRAVARGMGIRHDLAALAAQTPFDDSGKASLQSIASDAMEAAGASTGRNTGSALHALTDDFDRADAGERVNIVRRSRPDIAADLKAYAQTMHAHGLSVEPDLIERMTVCPVTESAGTFDRMVRCPDGVLRVADVKSGQHADEYGYYELAQQLAQYANGYALWRVLDRATGQGVWEPFPKNVDTSLGILIWLPAGQAHCKVFYVNLAEGIHDARDAARIRARRKASKGWVVPLPPPAGTLAGQVAEVLAMPDTGVAGMIKDSLLSAADDAGVLDAPTGEPAEYCYECDTDAHRCQGCGAAVPHGRSACPSCYPPAANPRWEFVASGHAGCVECLAPGEDPAPWCDCRADERCPVGASCHWRAHPVDQCVARQPGPTEPPETPTEPPVNAATEALDELLIMRIKACPTIEGLLAMANEHAAVWTADMQAAAAARWNELEQPDPLIT